MRTLVIGHCAAPFPPSSDVLARQNSNQYLVRLGAQPRRWRHTLQRAEHWKQHTTGAGTAKKIACLIGWVGAGLAKLHRVVDAVLPALRALDVLCGTGNRLNQLTALECPTPTKHLVRVHTVRLRYLRHARTWLERQLHDAPLLR